MCRADDRDASGDVCEPQALPPLTAVSAIGTALVAALLASAVMVPTMARAQQAAPCSGLACLFGHASPPPAQPLPTSPADAVPPASAVPSGSAVTKAESDKPPTAPKPARPVVTIAARATEVARLKSLAAAMPRERVRIVPVVDANEPAEADFTVSKAIGGTRVKARLFTEQLHIVAGDKVQTVADLAGKVVAFAGGGDAQDDAARQAFATLNIKVKDTPLDLANALDGLSTGDIEAVIILAPQPVSQLAVLGTPGLHLISWPEGGPVPEGAVITSIDGGRYPQLAKPGASIRALGVDAGLRMSAKGAKDPAARAFLASLAKNAAALSKHGFGLLKADVGGRGDGRLASAERR